MTYMVKCDRCGAEAEQYEDAGFVTLNFYRRDTREMTKHYCSVCSTEIAEYLGIKFEKIVYDDDSPTYVRGA